MFEDFDDDLGPFDDLEPAEGAQKALAVLKAPGSDEERGEAAIFLGSLLDLVDEDGTFDLGVPLDLAKQLHAELWAIYDNRSEVELVRRRCLEALVRWPIDPVPGAVRVALDTPGKWRVTGLFCAGFVMGYEDDVRAAVRSGTLEEKIEAWRATANLELQDLAGTAIRVALDGEAPQDERVEAIGALAWIGEPIEAQDALERLTEHSIEEIAEAAEEALSLRAASAGEEWFEGEE